ncbi:MAG TPA: HPF/RaiA family ribosome-associated protein [Burkholderiales bacterium]|jgi:ribosome-associated translation inhibitor RaiA|nr:HPF/RaiA family ribosome-associated protein [Burkholderiales bacterium]
MQIQINSDHHITGSPELAAQVQSLVRDSLDRYSDRITRVEVHLNDLNSIKHGNHDKRCLMEARLGGLGPVAVDHEADNLELAINGAMEKLERAIEHKLGKLAVSATGKRSVNE